MGNKREQENNIYDLLNKFGNIPNVKRINLKAKVLSYKGITYIDRTSVTQMKSNMDIDKVIGFVRHQVLDLYLKHVNIYHMSDDEWDDIIVDKDNKYRNTFNGIDMNSIFPYIDSLTKEIAPRDNKTLTWKIVSSKGSIYIEMYNIGYIIMIFDNETNVCTINLIPFDDSHSLFLNYGSIGPFYISKKDRYIDQVINKTKATLGHTIDAYYINILYYALKLYKPYQSHLEEVKHTPLETKIFSKMTRHAVGVNEFNTNIFYKVDTNKINEVTDFNSIPILVYDRSLKFPIVDFSKREWNFIMKYIESKRVIGETIYIDASESLKDTKYGDTLKIVFEDDKTGNEFECITSICYLQETDQCTFHIVYYINEDISIYSTVIYSDMKHFNPSENFVSISTDLYLNYLNDNISSIPSSIEELRSISPSIFFDTEDMMDIIASIISVHVIIHDRPERSRMIKEVRKNTLYKSNKSNNIKNHTSKNSETITSHILLPTNDAKRYLKEAAESNGEVYREYVVETWERKGYYRRKSGSDEKVFVRATTCTRHKELTKKEVHVKL